MDCYDCDHDGRANPAGGPTTPATGRRVSPAEEYWAFRHRHATLVAWIVQVGCVCGAQSIEDATRVMRTPRSGRGRNEASEYR